VRAFGLHQRGDAGTGSRARRDRRVADHFARHPGGIRLVAVRRRLHLRDQDRRHRIRIQQSVQSGCLYRRRTGAFPAHLCGQCDGARRRRRRGLPMTSILDRPLKARTFTGVSLRRRLANVVATVLVTLSLGLALGPLMWVRYSVVAKGLGTVESREWWTHSQADMTAFLAGGGAYPAIVGTVLQGLVGAATSTPIGVFVAVYLV